MSLVEQQAMLIQHPQVVPGLHLQHIQLLSIISLDLSHKKSSKGSNSSVGWLAGNASNLVLHTLAAECTSHVLRGQSLIF